MMRGRTIGFIAQLTLKQSHLAQLFDEIAAELLHLHIGVQ
jgi:hypothetical protein